MEPDYEMPTGNDSTAAEHPVAPNMQQSLMKDKRTEMVRETETQRIYWMKIMAIVLMSMCLSVYYIIVVLQGHTVGILAALIAELQI